MPAILPDTTDTHVLSGREADRLWQWLLSRQGLGSAVRHETVRDIADVTLGLHAARLPSPFATILARAHSPDVAMQLWQPETHRAVTTIRCMRKTLHTLPLSLAPAAHAATLHYRARDALRQIINAGLSDRLVSRTTKDISLLLTDNEHLSHRQIEQRLDRGMTSPIAVRLALKLAWERGLLTYRNRSTSWNQERRTFALTVTAHPDLDLNIDRDNGTVQLIDAYLDRYGPASIRDVMWWSGLSRGAILAALDRIDKPLVALRTPWSPANLFMFGERFEQFQRIVDEGSPIGVHLLAHEDVALKAYAETRSRYLGTVDERSAFNQIGEALPTVVTAGRVIGVWSWNAQARSVAYTLFRGLAGPTERCRTRSAAAVLSAGLRQGHADSQRLQQQPSGGPEPAGLIASATP